MKNIVPIGLILFITLVIISSSGCTGNGISYKTFTSQYMSFQYPEGWTTELNSVDGVIIRENSSSTDQQWFEVTPYGTNGGNMLTLADFKTDMATDISESNPPDLKNGNINGTSYEYTEDSNSGDGNSGKSIFFTKNGKSVIIYGYVKDMSVLEHVVATFN